MKTHHEPGQDVSSEHEDEIGCGKAHFTWANEHTSGADTPSRGVFRLRIEQDLVFKKGSFNLITGPTGSGKTSLLMALLKEMHYIPLGPDSWVNLPRRGGVAYAAQESWIQNDTIKVCSLILCSSAFILIVRIGEYTFRRAFRRGTLQQR